MSQHSTPDEITAVKEKEENNISSSENKRQAGAIMEKPQKKPKMPRRTLARNNFTFGDALATVSDAMLCLPAGTSKQVMQDVTAALKEDESVSSIDPDETVVTVYSQQVRNKQQETIELLKRIFPNDWQRYSEFILLDNPQLTGRVTISKALKGFSAIAEKMESKMEEVCKAFEDAINENK